MSLLKSNTSPCLPSALLNLGYVQGQINSAINEAIPQEKEMKLEKLIKNCIKILSS